MTSPGEPDPSQPSPRPAWTEALVIGCLLAAGLAVLLGLGVIQPQKKILPPPPPVPGSPPAPAEKFALEALEKFFEGAGLEEKLSFVKDSARVRPMMEDYHLKRGHPFPTMGRVSPGKILSMGSRQFVFFEVEPFSGPRYPVAMEWDGFRYALDWESLTAYGTMDWPKFVAEKPQTAQTMRVYLSALAEELRPPGMAKGWQAFRMEHRDSDAVVPLLANPELSAEVAKRVAGKRVPLTLELAWNPSAAGGGAFEILRLVAEVWSQ